MLVDSITQQQQQNVESFVSVVLSNETHDFFSKFKTASIAGAWFDDDASTAFCALFVD